MSQADDIADLRDHAGCSDPSADSSSDSSSDATTPSDSDSEHGDVQSRVPKPIPEVIIAAPPQNRVQYNGPWTKIPIFRYGVFVGFLVHNSPLCQLDAQCHRPMHRGGLKCHIHRTLARSPLGYLLAWILYDGCHTRNSHFAKRKERHEGTDCPLSHANRVAARQWGESQPLLEEFFTLERVWGSGEEPVVLT
jgi:hypothetical protein